MKWFLLFSGCLCLSKVKFFFRTNHPDVEFHKNRLSTSKKALQSDIDEFGLSQKVKFDELTLDPKKYYSDFLILNALPDLAKRYSPNTEWICFLEESARVRLEHLLEHLEEQKSKKPKIIGRALYDQAPAIIHHFFGVGGGGEDYRTFGYPDFDAGFCMNQPLINNILQNYSKWYKSPNFQIDPKHELMRFINDNLEVKLTNSIRFCAGNAHRNNNKCFTRSEKALPDCGLTNREDIMVAVKTVSKYHTDRLRVVQKTWGPKFSNIVYYSDKRDDEFNTVQSPQTESGHCAKLYYILKDFLQRDKFNWLLVADDDTILSAYRIHRITACYDPKKPVFIGERYGYGLNTGSGYPYVTGGGGMLFSKAAVLKWKNNGCSCPTDDSPDDMIIGGCMARSRVPIVHLNNFHQAKWQEYSEGYLDNNAPVSFHKHYDIDPYQIYAQWFGLDDTKWWSTYAHDHPDKHKHRDEL